MSSSWEITRQISIPLPFNYDPTDTRPDLHMTSSQSHVVLAYKDRVYIHSLPSFELVHILEPGKLSQGHIKILGEILIVTCALDDSEYRDPQHTPEDVETNLFVWVLAAGKAIGTIDACGDSLYVHETICLSRIGMAEIRDNGKSSGKDPQTIPVLIVSSTTEVLYPNNRLRTYVLHQPDAGGTETLVKEVNAPPNMHPTTMVYPIHDTLSLASMGRIALTGGCDKTVRVWDVVAEECKLVLIGHTAAVTDVELDETKIYSTSCDTTLRIWDRHRGDCLHVLGHLDYFHPGPDLLPVNMSYPYIVSLAFRSDPSSRQGTTLCGVHIWDPVSAQLVHKVDTAAFILGSTRGHQHTFMTREVTDDSMIDSVNIWDLGTGRRLASIFIESHHQQLRTLCSQDQFLMVVVQQEGQYFLKVWDFGIDGSTDKANVTLDIQSDVPSLESDAKMDDVGKRGEDDLGEAMSSAQMHSDGSADEESEGITIPGKRKRGKGRDIARPWENPRQFLVPLPFEVNPLQRPPPHLVCSDTHLVLGYKNRVYIYSLPAFALIHTMETGTLIHSYPLRIHRRMLIVLSKEDDSNPVVSLDIWDLNRGKHIGTVKTSGDKFGELDSRFPYYIMAQVTELDDNAKSGISRDLMLILYCEEANVFETYVLHDIDESRPSTMLPATKTHSIHQVQCLEALGRTIVTGGFDSTVRVWDVVTGECRLVLMGHAERISDVFLNENRIYSASFDGTTRVWDRHSGDCLQVLNMAHVHSDGITLLDIASAHLITRDSFLKTNGSRIGIWNPTSGELMHQITTQHITMIAQTFQSKQCILVTTEIVWASNEQWFRFWDTNSGKILAHFSICGPGRLMSWQGELLHCFQERFFLAVVEEDERIMLKVWDLGGNESPETRVDDNECTDSDAIPATEVEITTTTECEKGKSTIKERSASIYRQLLGI
ncbi:hypothetical protein CVT26_015556 [Gymnopilus dilepis]|uniref:Anaphase-promoting complex subunit 4 WD40 domain-containing protein n=1 Tax=Gymnopilus dilepis TaxID=231916 RepID=A0A409YD67_9AGAR|nr:hypothetical protein CVT26_015556 [Gymnopilus dilepis]